MAAGESRIARPGPRTKRVERMAASTADVLLRRLEWLRLRHDEQRSPSCRLQKRPLTPRPMCARRFLMAIFVLTLLVVAAAFAVYQWGGNVLLREATPKGHFVAAAAGGGPD